MARMAAPVEELGENRVRLTVEVPSAQVKHAVEHAVRTSPRASSSPASGKGRSPSPCSSRGSGRSGSTPRRSTATSAAGSGAPRARNRVRPIADPQFEFELPSTAEEPWTFAATVEVQPLPEIVDWTTLEVARDGGRGPAGVDRRRDRGAARIRRRARAAEGRPARERRHGRRSTSSIPRARHSATPSSSSAQVGSRASSSRRSSGHRRARRRRSPFRASDGESGRPRGHAARREREGPAADRRRPGTCSERVRHARGAPREHRGDASASSSTPRSTRPSAMAAVDELVKESKVQPALRSSNRAPRPSQRLRPLARAARHLARGLSAGDRTSAEDLQRQMVMEAAVSRRARARARGARGAGRHRGLGRRREAYLREEAERSE